MSSAVVVIGALRVKKGLGVQESKREDKEVLSFVNKALQHLLPVSSPLNFVRNSNNSIIVTHLVNPSLQGRLGHVLLYSLKNSLKKASENLENMKNVQVCNPILLWECVHYHWLQFVLKYWYYQLP